MSPGTIAVLIEAHVYGNAVDCVNMKHDMKNSGMFTRLLVEDGLIEFRDGYALHIPDLWAENAPPPYKTTEKGVEHITTLCRIPLPIQDWIPGDQLLRMEEPLR